MLELSGIGNKDILTKAGVETKIELPSVGENYHDHLLNYMGFTIPNEILTWDAIGDPAKNKTVWDM